MACVLDFDERVFGGNERGLAKRLAFRGRDISRADGDFPALAHRVARVDDQVDDNLFELVEVGLDEPKVARMHDDELDLLADQPAQHHLQLGEHVRQEQRLRPKRLAAREREQLAHQPRRPIGVLFDLHDVLERRIGRAVVGEQ